MKNSTTIGENKVLICRLSDASRGHSLSGDAVEAAIDQVVAITEGRSTARSILLRGGGSSFCSGGDITTFAGTEDKFVAVHAAASQFHRLVSKLNLCPVPVVAAVDGWAAGAGFSLANAADIVVADSKTRFTSAYAKIGFAPDGGMAWTLPRRIGEARARDLLLTARVVDGTEAAAIGLATRLVDDGTVLTESEAIAAGLAKLPTASMKAIKGLFAGTWGKSLDEHLTDEANAIASCASTPDGVEGVAAFLEKRHPNFS